MDLQLNKLFLKTLGALQESEIAAKRFWMNIPGKGRMHVFIATERKQLNGMQACSV